MFSYTAPEQLPWITTDDMREIDRIMVEDLGIDLPRMMEGAGRSLARLAELRFRPQRVSVLVGTGGNGGGGLVAARHLANHGIEVTLLLSRPIEALAPVPRAQFDICERLGIPVADEVGEADLIIDALVGYSLSGSPRGRTAELIEAANRHGAPVLALDTPSGLDTTTGEAGEPSINATATLTLAAPKIGLRSSDLVGDLHVADISVPPSTYEGLGFGTGPVFGSGPIIQVGTARPVLIRRERAADGAAVADIHRAAFGQEVEADLAVALRNGGHAVPELSLVAVIDDEIVGHVVCSWGSIGSIEAVGLGPIGVVPGRQRDGVGTALMHAVIGAADAIGEPLIALLGNPDYYRRFGFVPSTEIGVVPPDPAWADYFQVRTLAGHTSGIVGTFHYASPFDEV